MGRRDQRFASVRRPQGASRLTAASPRRAHKVESHRAFSGADRLRRISRRSRRWIRLGQRLRNEGQRLSDNISHPGAHGVLAHLRAEPTSVDASRLPRLASALWVASTGRIGRRRGRSEPAVGADRRPARQPRRVVLEEQLRDELAAGADAGLLEDRLQVVLHRARREVQLVRRFAFVDSPCATSWVTAPLALGQPVGVGDERRELGRAGGLEDHGGPRVGASPSTIRARRSQRPAAVRTRARAIASGGAGRRRRSGRGSRPRRPPGGRAARCGAARSSSSHICAAGFGERDRVVVARGAAGRRSSPPRLVPASAVSSIARRRPSASVARQRADDVSRRWRRSARPSRCAQQRQRAPGAPSRRRARRAARRRTRSGRLSSRWRTAAVEVTAGGPLRLAAGRPPGPASANLLKSSLAQLDLGHARPSPHRAARSRPPRRSAGAWPDPS